MEKRCNGVAGISTWASKDKREKKTHSNIILPKDDIPFRVKLSYLVYLAYIYCNNFNSVETLDYINIIDPNILSSGIGINRGWKLNMEENVYRN